MADFVIIAVLVVILGIAGGYLIKAKRNGQKCIGCPYSKTCSAGKGGSSCCNCHSEQ
ncbi:MAG: FeoB-associated Cys-rich membrane protein [Clostridia bacterium]|nr:FeoB-associated Cys-rich membrane protein [Clostridia bacterium]